jgi:hypothetical protein
MAARDMEGEEKDRKRKEEKKIIFEIVIFIFVPSQESEKIKHYFIILENSICQQNNECSSAYGIAGIHVFFLLKIKLIQVLNLEACLSSKIVGAVLISSH